MCPPSACPLPTWFCPATPGLSPPAGDAPTPTVRRLQLQGGLGVAALLPRGSEGPGVPVGVTSAVGVGRGELGSGVTLSERVPVSTQV